VQFSIKFIAKEKTMYLTVKQAAERLQVSKKTIFRRIADGSLVACRLTNKTLRIDEIDLESYMNKLKTKERL
jgi:excisionase family DNA binding protein